jgi:hypothetical protein
MVCNSASSTATPKMAPPKMGITTHSEPNDREARLNNAFEGTEMR